MNFKKLLKETNSIITELDPYLIRIVQLIKNQKSSKIRQNSFIEFNDFLFDSEVLLKTLYTLKYSFSEAIEESKTQISHFQKKREALEYKYTLYEKLESLLQRISNPTKIRYAMYSAYGELWEDFLEDSTLEILDEMDYGRSVSSKLYRNVEQVLDVFSGETTPFAKIDRNIKFYTLLIDGMPKYVQTIDNRIKIICQLKKVVA